MSCKTKLLYKHGNKDFYIYYNLFGSLFFWLLYLELDFIGSLP